MKRLLIVAAGLILLAGCSTNQNSGGTNGDSTTVGISGGATGTPSGTSQDPLGSGGVDTTRTAPTNGSTTQP